MGLTAPQHYHYIKNKKLGGSGEIRTHGCLSTSPVFKTGAFNRSATLPYFEFSLGIWKFLLSLRKLSLREYYFLSELTAKI
jgi:hypothetical protein